MFFFLVFYACFTLSVDYILCDETCEQGQQIECENFAINDLKRLRANVIGESKQIALGGKLHQIRTISLKPVVFEVGDFLSPEECEHLIKLAKVAGLKESITINEHAAGSAIRVLDISGDKRLSVSEMMLTIQDNFDIYFSEEDILNLYTKLSIDKNGDQYITPDELSALDNKVFIDHIKDLSAKQPSKRSRHSKQTWIEAINEHDSVFTNIQNRVQELTQLDAKLIETSDCQIVNYGVNGHYNAHYDSVSVNKQLPCCDNRLVKTECRICRFATVMMYLNDVEEGGETAFPVANNKTLDTKAFIQAQGLDLVRYCYSANLLVKPVKGKLVLWYNHHIDENTGWVGDLDEYSYHGGCPVTKGSKWIANFWIKATDSKEEFLRRYHG